MLSRNTASHALSSLSGAFSKRATAKRRAIASCVMESLEPRTLLSTSPVITTANHDTLYAGVGGSYTVIAQGSPVPTWGETGALPSGITFVDNGDGTATFTVAPTTNSSTPTVTITASNGATPDASQSFTLQILQPNLLNVTNLNDSGPGSLRQAIITANLGGGVDLIEPAAGITGKISLKSALPNLAANILIMGKGLTVSGAASTGPVFTVNAGFTCEFHNLTITGGTGITGGGIDNEGTLSLFNSTITGNAATSQGGGIFNDASATLTVTDCTINQNNAVAGGGGIYSAGGTLTLIDSTISSNSAGQGIDSGGGGIAAEGGSGTLTVTNCTIAFNKAEFAGGISDDGAVLTLTDCTIDQNKTISDDGGVVVFVQGPPVVINGTIIANNTGPDLQSGGNTVITGSFDLIGDGSDIDPNINPLCNLTHTLRGTETRELDPRLAGLASNGGPTPTQAEMAGAPGIGMGADFPILDATNADITKTDQRHFNRPRNGGIDIGAFQLPPTFAATRIVILPIAKSFTAGSTIASSSPGTSFSVNLVNARGQIDSTNSSLVTIAIASGPNGAILNGPLTVQAAAGVAVISGLSLNTAGSYTLQATDPGLITGVSNKFTMTPDTASAHLVVAQQPGDTIVGTNLTPNLVIDVKDQFNNIVTSDHSKVTLSILNGPIGAHLGGTTTATVSKGIATFSKATISMVGGYILQATDTTLQGTSPTFNVNVTPGVSTLAAPHVASTYKSEKTINLSAMLKSSAAPSISFTGTAAVVDQNDVILGTAGVAANGAIKFSLTGVAAGTHTCTVQYPGDANHDPINSSTFILHVI